MPEELLGLENDSVRLVSYRAARHDLSTEQRRLHESPDGSEQFPKDRKAYADGKHDFIRVILNRAR